MCPKEFLYAPSVFAVGDRYRVCLCASCEGTLAVRVGKETFYDATGGILRSKKYLHAVEVPQPLLDREKSYTLEFREFTDRKPYFPESREPVLFPVDFRPVTAEQDAIRLYHIADTHGKPEFPIRCGKYYGIEPDVLILNGDIADHSGDAENFKTLYEIAGAVTGGHVPCIFSRGNHDLRGACAEILCDYTPTNAGLPYYTFRLGPVWGLVMDCGEDKGDEHAEYGHSVVCHDFRLLETRFLESVIANKETEYAAPDVRYKLLISHVPFAKRYEDPFNPEEPLYTKWCRLLREYVRPELWLTGHKHTARLIGCGEKGDDFGQPCPCVIGSKPVRGENGLCGFVGAAVILEPDKNTVRFTDETGAVESEFVLTKQA